MRKFILFVALLFSFMFIHNVSTQAATIDSDLSNYSTVNIESVKINTIVNIANTRIDIEIIKAQMKADNLPLDDNYDAALNQIITDLIQITDSIAADAQVKLSKYDVTVIFEYKTVTIGNREVEVDPIRVHFW